VKLRLKEARPRGRILCSGAVPRRTPPLHSGKSQNMSKAPRPANDDHSARLPEGAEAPTLDPLVPHRLPTDLEAATIPPPSAAAGDGEKPYAPTVPGYEILSELGRGGMGVVYQARQLSLNRVVALKMILAGGHAGEDELARFRLEAEALALLRHPNIVQIYEVGTHEGRPFLALEFLEGGSLAGQLEKGIPTPAAAAALVEALARAVHAAHERGIVHRDLKPENVLLDRDDTPKITDFGLAKRLEDRAGQTASNAVVGTPSYMAPEQAEGKSRLVGPAADVYALGAILYRLLTGRPPFQGPTNMDVLLQVVANEPAPPRRLCPQVPRDLEIVCLKCLRKQPADRYAEALELAEDLRRFQAGEPIRARPVGRAERLVKWARRQPALAAACVLGVLVLLLGFGWASAVWLWQRAEGAFQQADVARQEATAARDQVAIAFVQEQLARKGEAEARRDLARLSYYRAIDLAHREWRDNELARAEQLLQDCPVALRGWEWHYVRRLCHGELLTLRGGGGSVAFSPDGGRLASGCQDGTVKVWDTQTAKEVLTLKGDRGWVRSVAFSSDGLRLASASLDGTVRVWDAQTGQLSLTLEKAGEYVALSPDGRRLACAFGQDKAVKVWDAHTGRLALTLEGHSRVYAVAFSPDGRRLASGSALDGTIKVWDVPTAQESLTLKGHAGPVQGLAFSPDGKRLASASSDRTVRVWDALTGQEAFTLKGHESIVFGAAFSPDGRRLASASGDRTIKVWDAQTGQELRTLKGHTNLVSSVAFSPDGRRLASASADGSVKVWDAHAGPHERTLKGNFNVSFSADGRCMASSIQGRTVRVWDPLTGQLSLTLEKAGSYVAFSPDGRRLACGSHEGRLDQPGEITVWDALTRQLALTLRGQIGPVYAVAFSPDGRRLASASSDNTLKVWDAQTGQLTLSFKPGINNMTRIAFSPDGRRLAIDAWDQTVKVWDALTGQLTLTLKRRGGSVGSLAFSPDGRRLACAPSFDGPVKVWDTQTGDESLSLKGGFRCVAFSPDGRRLASASHGSTLRVWDAQTGQEALTLNGHTGPVHAVAFSPDGKLLVSASPKAVKVWDATPLPDGPPVRPAPGNP
jgi:WD40 repeat protein